MENMEIWDKVKQPPKDVLKKIKGGRLKGMTDINPQWRYRILTDVFGPCGVGWKFEIVEHWVTDGSDGVKVSNAKINLYYNTESGWSTPIPGVGGSMLVAKESGGLYTSDESLKMAVTDALSTAAKMIGVGADIYAGKWDGSKYKDDGPGPSSQKITADQKEAINSRFDKLPEDRQSKFLSWLKVSKVDDIGTNQFNAAVQALDKSLE